MKQIKSDDVWSIKMFSKEGWQRISEALKDVHPYSNEMTLADGFIEFLDVWLDDHKLDCDLHEPEIKTVKGKSVYAYFNDNTGRYVYFDDDTDLEDALLTRYSECLLGD